MAHLVSGWAEGMDPLLERNEGASRRAAAEARQCFVCVCVCVRACVCVCVSE